MELNCGLFVCLIPGFLLDFEVYTDKDKSTNEKCALGSRVVLKMLQKFFKNTSSYEVLKYHVTFDNFFTSPDLLRLVKTILRATGTVKDDRVFTKAMLRDLTGSINVSSNSKKSKKPVKILSGKKSETTLPS